jgi:hypothetical protein
LAQVKDVSFILSPKAGYDWFDANSTVDNGLIYGFDAGFGFGNIFELRGIYRHSEDLSQTFGKYQSDISDILNDEDFSFKSRNISVRRYGGELKVNILPGKYSPYLTIGTGVQTFKRDFSADSTYKNKNLYASLGLGVKLNITHRVSFDIGGKSFIYNMNPGSFFYDPNASSAVDKWIGNLNSRTMVNWELSAGLSFYLGGVKRQKLSPLEKAYLRRFSGKLYGVKFTFAPAGSYVNFDDKSNFKDTYMLGGMLGVDFTNYFGLHAYYLHSTKNKKLSFNFDNLAMYGVDLVGKLNIPRGIVPYITIGGGYLNALDGYRGKNYDMNKPASDQKVNSKYYAKGGVGVNIPLSTNLSIFGSAALFYTKADKNKNITDLSSTDQLRQHSMFTAGLRVRFGKKANSKKATNKAFRLRFEPKRQHYQKKIKGLKKQLDKAYAQNDTLKMAKIMREKEQLEQKAQRNRKENQKKQRPSNRFKPGKDTLKVELVNAYKHNNMKKMKQIMEEKQKIQARKDSLKRAANAKGNGMVRMTPEELQSLINKTLDHVAQKQDSMIIINKLNHIEQLVLNLKNNQQRQPAPAPKAAPNQQGNNQPKPKEGGTKKNKMNNAQKANGTNGNAPQGALNNKMNELNQKLETQNNRIKQLQRTLNAQHQQGKKQKGNVTVVNPRQRQHNNAVSYNNGMLHEGFAAFIGYGLGDVNSLNIGVRRYYGFRNTSFFFMPAAYIAVAHNYGFGVSANGIYQFNLKMNPRLNPYAGLGLGINFVGGKFSLNPNFILGTLYRLGRSGSILFDYTIRGNFKYNQLAIGYRFRF